MFAEALPNRVLCVSKGFGDDRHIVISTQPLSMVDMDALTEAQKTEAMRIYAACQKQGIRQFTFPCCLTLSQVVLLGKSVYTRLPQCCCVQKDSHITSRH